MNKKIITPETANRDVETRQLWERAKREVLAPMLLEAVHGRPVPSSFQMLSVEVGEECYTFTWLSDNAKHSVATF